jgi:ferric-dicitrate binding protein FerR (iron transport regulator)
MDKKLENIFYKLTALKLSGEATAQDLEQLEAIITNYPELRFFSDQIIKPPAQEGDKAQELAEQYYAAHAVDMHLKGLWQDNKNSTPEPGITVRKKTRRYAVFASLILAAAIFPIMILPRRPVLQNIKNETATTKGSKSTVKLPDGTVVMLNANSRLSHYEKFKGETREVSLTGEAYFDVVHDPAHPFIIHTPAGDIKVLGTSFNVKAFANGFLETTLIHGKVAIFLKNHKDNNFVLSPGQKLVTRNSGHSTDSVAILPITTLKDTLVAETSWTKGQLVFVNKPLVDIAKDLERIFDVTIQFKSDKAKEYRYTGVYDDTSLDQILEILQLSRHITYHRDKNIIYID